MKRKTFKQLLVFSLIGFGIALVAFKKTYAEQQPGNNTISRWFPYYDFDAATFQNAPRKFGPFTRWWLPGNDITNEELQREIQMFAENGFAGVEIQPLIRGLNPNASKDQKDRIYSWDTPSYYEHLRAIMQQAQKSGIVVDMNGGSGWPLGGPFVDPGESIKTLAVSDTALMGGQLFEGPLPAPHNHDQKPEGALVSRLIKNLFDEKLAVLQNVIAARISKKEEKQIVLDPATLVNLTNKVQNGKLTWQAPAKGKWQLVATWMTPSGEKPSLIASSKVSYVIDHLDPLVVKKSYDYLLGERSGLPKFYSKPMRAVFNDSYEFHIDRFFSSDLLTAFKAMNGYDIAPYLSSVFQKGYNHPVNLSRLYQGAKPPFTFYETENWRMMYDYDRTLNEVFKNNFIKTSNDWMKQHGLLHRTQAYGFPIDLIGGAGATDIPEAEQLFAGGSEGYLKLVTSGAHLYNHPVITQESFVSRNRAEMTTPQKIKMWADKSFACGINQLIYHGTPYKYNNGDYGNEGWNTWSSPFSPSSNYSTGMNESDPFWKDIKEMNQYLSRCQYALRAGKPKTEVLIYMPFIDFTSNQIAPNPTEILFGGYFEGVEPDITDPEVSVAPKTLINEWYSRLSKIVNELEAKGISWEFVNDESLQKAKLSSGKINIEGNEYQALILANLPYINLATVKHISTLSKRGLNLWLIGELPQKQPSFRNYEVNDRLANHLLKEAGEQINSKQVAGEMPLSTIIQKISFANPVDFSRQITREMKNGSQIKFIWNKSDHWQTILLNLDKSFAASYWLNPENGTIEKNNGVTVTYQLPPYGSVILYAAKNVLFKNLLSGAELTGTNFKDILKIEKWTIKVADVTLQNASLIDWRTNEQLKHKSDEGVYTAIFNMKEIVPGKRYFLDLGKVYFTAGVQVNDKEAGKRLFAPYQMDITKFLKSGNNIIEVRITTTRRNRFIGEALKGNLHYAQFKDKENTLMPSGLVGPVIIKSL